MKLYILKLYGTPQKENDYCDVAGYYTNEKALFRALKKHSDELGIINNLTVKDILFGYWGYVDCRKFNTHAELASLETIETNQWTA